MKFSDRMSLIAPSATLEVSAKAAKLKAEGRSIISLSLGEPDFPVPSHVVEAVKKAASTARAPYTPVGGMPEAKDAVATYYKRVYNVSMPRECIILCNGGKQVLYNLFQVMLNPGDEVLVPSPHWLSYPDMIRMAGATPVSVYPSNNQTKITPRDLSLCLTSKTKMLVLNSPSNPTGICYSQNELTELAFWAIENNIFVISDEIYDQLSYLPEGTVSLSPLLERHSEHLFITNGLAKAFSMPGWRAGYGAGHPEIITKMTTLQGQSTSNICSLAQAAVISALNGSYKCTEDMRETYRSRRDVALSYIKNWPRVTYPTPDGAFYIFLNVSKLFTKELPTATSMCAYLMDKAGVALVPGTPFGDEDCLRLSYSTDEQTLRTAMENLSPFLGVK